MKAAIDFLAIIQVIFHQKLQKKNHFAFKNLKTGLGMIVCVYNHSTGQAESGDHEFEDNLGYIVKPCLSNKNNNRGEN